MKKQAHKGLLLNSRKAESCELFHRSDARAQAGLVASRSIFVESALADRFIESGDGGPIGLLGCLLVALGDRLAQIAECRPQTGGVGAVARRASRGLPGALQRRKMICHV